MKQKCHIKDLLKDTRSEVLYKHKVHLEWSLLISYEVKIQESTLLYSSVILTINENSKSDKCPIS